jgi:hypothetical protein
MSKFIIRNDSVLLDELAMRYVLRVIDGGKISNFGKQYCYHTSFTYTGGQDVHVSCIQRKSGTMTFYITSEEHID